MSGPLAGLRVVEIAGLGPVPYACTILGDLGADVIRVDRVGTGALGSWSDARFDVLSRSRRSIAVNLKDPRGVDTVLRLADRADALVEGFRPGVAERLGIGPEQCLGRNRKLVYGRMTGWGQDGPLAMSAGHDINYIALTGALHAIGPGDGPPSVPLNLVGDFGGGSLFLVVGVLSAVFAARESGEGQVVDAAMVDGASSLMAVLYGAMASGFWKDARASNMLDGAAPYYRTYETADGRYVAIGAIEPQFYLELLRLTGLDGAELPEQNDRGRWPELHHAFEQRFRTKTRAQWCEIMEGSDACFAPVLSMGEASEHAHMKARGTFVDVEGIVQPGPAPRFSNTPAGVESPPTPAGAHTDDVLAEIGMGGEEIAALRDDGVVS